MPDQTIYLVINICDYDTPAFVMAYTNEAAALAHAADLNTHLAAEEDEPVFVVWEETALSEFQP